MKRNLPHETTTTPDHHEKEDRRASQRDEKEAGSARDCRAQKTPEVGYFCRRAIAGLKKTPEVGYFCTSHPDSPVTDHAGCFQCAAALFSKVNHDSEAIYDLLYTHPLHNPFILANG